MAFLWIFAFAFVAAAAKETAPPGAVEGCGETPTTPGPKQFGVVTDVNSCKKKILMMKGRPYPASCTVVCPRRNYTIRDWKPCLELTADRILEERQDETVYKCKVGACVRGQCRLLPFPSTVPCKVPDDVRLRQE
uniref:Evasin n=1 Tax=Amblyomma parvum TaxID=251391 RepID=A0A023G209_AMBPA